MELELRQLVRGIRRWWWIAVLGPVALAALAYVYTARQQPLYAAEATLLINPAETGGTLNYNSVLTAERLTKTYQKLIKNRVVLQSVVEELALPYDARVLGEKITATSDTDTQLLRVRVSDTDPEMAAQIANAVAKQFAGYIADQAGELSGQSKAEIDQQVADLRGQIDDLQQQIADLQSQPNASDPVIQDQIEFIRGTLDTLQPVYAQLLLLQRNIEVNAAVAVGRVIVAEPAFAPQLPYAPRRAVNLLLGVLVGAMIAAGLIVMLEYLDNTVKATADFNSLVGAPMLTTVTTIPKLTQGLKQLFVLEQPKGGAAESIRLLRTNIEFASATKVIATLGVTSPNPGEGKSTISANLAVTLAQAGFVTVLIDADLRRPSQHRIFGLSNERGLSTLLSMPDRPWSWAAQGTMLPNLTLIPAGPLPPNPADLLSLERLRELLHEMRQTFDVIVLDTPPVLAVSDPLIVAAHVDGMVLVTLAGKTRLDQLKRAAQTLQRGAIRLVGVIVNQQSGRGAEGYYFAEYHAVEDGARAGQRNGEQAEPSPALTNAGQTSAN